MYCKKCGNPIDGENVVCKICGAVLERTQIDPTTIARLDDDPKKLKLSKKNINPAKRLKPINDSKIPSIFSNKHYPPKQIAAMNKVFDLKLLACVIICALTYLLTVTLDFMHYSIATTDIVIYSLIAFGTICYIVSIAIKNRFMILSSLFIMTATFITGGSMLVIFFPQSPPLILSVNILTTILFILLGLLSFLFFLDMLTKKILVTFICGVFLTTLVLLIAIIPYEMYVDLTSAPITTVERLSVIQNILYIVSKLTLVGALLRQYTSVVHLKRGEKY